MKKNISLVWALIATMACYGQTAIDKSFAINAGQKLVLKFDYPQLIRVTTWDKAGVAIRGSIEINSGENDNAFVIESSSSGKTLTIVSEVQDLKGLPKRYTITDEAGKKVMFKDVDDLKQYRSQHGQQYKNISMGVDIEIQLEVFVPRNTETEVIATYGTVEVRDFAGPILVEATYGGVDAAVDVAGTGELVAETDFGQIYSNLNL